MLINESIILESDSKLYEQRSSISQDQSRSARVVKDNYYKLNQAVVVDTMIPSEGANFEPNIILECFLEADVCVQYYDFVLQYKYVISAFIAVFYISAVMFMTLPLITTVPNIPALWTSLFNIAFLFFFLYAPLIHTSILKLLITQFEIQYLLLIVITFSIFNFLVLKHNGCEPVIAFIHCFLVAIYFCVLFCIDAFPCVVFTPRFRTLLFCATGGTCFLVLFIWTFVTIPSPKMTIFGNEWNFHQLRLSCLGTIGLFKVKIVINSIFRPNTFLVWKESLMVVKQDFIKDHRI